MEIGPDQHRAAGCSFGRSENIWLRFAISSCECDRREQHRLRWRLKSGQGYEATDLAFNNDPFMIVNMSVWDSIESLREFTRRSREHLQMFRDRAQWFQKRTAETLSAVWCHAICVLVRNSFRSAC